MWEHLLDFGKTLVTLSDELSQTRDDIKDIRQELRDLSLEVARLAATVEQAKDREASERRASVLEVQNMLLRFERHIEHRLPPPKE